MDVDTTNAVTNRRTGSHRSFMPGIHASPEQLDLLHFDWSNFDD